MKSPIQILLIEDQEEHIAIIKKSLESNNNEYILNTAFNLKEAQTFLNNNKCDLIISDIQLPDGDGIELLKGLNGARFPVIMMTGYGNGLKVAEAIKAGAIDYIIKSDKNLIEIQRYIERALREWDNIIERQKAEDMIRLSERHYRELVENIPTGIAVIDVAGNIKDINAKMMEIMEWSSEKTSRSINIFNYKPLIKAGMSKAIKKCINEDKAQCFEHAYTSECNKKIYINNYFAPLHDPDGNTTGVLINVIDITQRKLAENALIESKAKYSMLVEKSNDGVAIIQDGIFKFINTMGAQISGYAADELIDTPLAELITPEYRNIITDMSNRLLSGKQIPDNFEVKGIHKNGNIIDLELSGRLIQYKDKPAILGIMRDVTERHKTEEALRKSEALYSALFQHIPIQTVVVDKEGKIIAYNKAKEASGDRLPSIGQVMYKDYASSHKLDMHKELLECISSGKMREFPELPYRDRILSIKTSPFEEGAIITSQDITLQKKAEKKIEHLNELLIAIRNIDQLITHEKNGAKLIQKVCNCLVQSRGHTNAWIALVDSSNTFSITSIMGFKHVSLNTLKNKNDINSFPCVKKALHSHKILTIDTVHSFCNTCPNYFTDDTIGRMVIKLEYNKKIYGIMNVGVLLDFILDEQEKSLLEEVAGDISFGLYNIELERERKELQKQLYRSARLSAVGQLAAGIAHEFNNLLSVILGHTQLSLEEDSIDDIKQSLREIEKTTKRGSGIVIKLAAFAKPKEPDFKIENITKVIDDVIQLQQRQLHLENIKIEKKYHSKSKISLDRGQMEQVFLNLLINSIHAIKPKARGKIVISVRDFGKNLEIRFADNGIGMDNSTKEKIFDPFFTTKGAWARDSLGISGTGLGLSIVHSIIKQHNGIITAKSTKNRGTTFIIRIPFVEKEKAIAIEEPEKAYNAEHLEVEKMKGMKILLVDDEDEMTDFFQHLFKKAGFENIKIENKGEKAVSIFKEFRPDIVFLDIIMPEMNGEQIFKEIKSIKADIPIVFMSGKIDIEKDHYLKNGAFDIIQKPFEINQIFNILNKVI